MDKIQIEVVGFLGGVFGYLLKKYVGEHISKYFVLPIMRLMNRFIVQPMLRWSKASLIKSEADMARYVHNHNKRLNRSHQHSQSTCNDGRCATI